MELLGTSCTWLGFNFLCSSWYCRVQRRDAELLLVQKAGGEPVQHGTAWHGTALPTEGSTVPASRRNTQVGQLSRIWASKAMRLCRSPYWGPRPGLRLSKPRASSGSGPQGRPAQLGTGLAQDTARLGTGLAQDTTCSLLPCPLAPAALRAGRLRGCLSSA